MVTTQRFDNLTGREVITCGHERLIKSDQQGCLSTRQLLLGTRLNQSEFHLSQMWICQFLFGTFLICQFLFGSFSIQILKTKQRWAFINRYKGLTLGVFRRIRTTFDLIIIMDTYIAPVSAKFDAHGA